MIEAVKTGRTPVLSGQNRAEVLIYGVIGPTVVDSVMAKLAAVPEAKELSIRLHSPGGSVSDGVAIFNALKRHPARKVVHIDGVAASMASYIMLAADWIVMARNARVMVHEPRMDTEGATVDDLASGAERLRAVRQIMLDGYAARTRKSADTVAGWLADETWFNADEALAAGLVDEIEGEMRMAALAADAVALLARFKHTPESLRAVARPKETPMFQPTSVFLTLTAEERRHAGAVATALRKPRAEVEALMLERKRELGMHARVAPAAVYGLTALERRMAREAAGSAPGAVERFEAAMLERKRELAAIRGR